MVLTTHWFVDTKSMGLYLSQHMMPYFSGTRVCFLVPIDIFFDRANKHEVHTSTGHFEVDLNLELITGGKTTLF